MKMVINRCFGGFGLSDKAEEMLRELGGCTHDHRYEQDIRVGRGCQKLVKVVGVLGSEANGTYADLCIVNVPDDAKEIYISNYDGVETIHETHRSW